MREELMAMKKEEIENFKKILLTLHARITHAIKSATEGVKETEESRGYSQHQADEGTDDFDKTISLEVSNKEFSILRRIDRSLEKIEDGTYGICDITGKEIPIARLKAIPYANMTVEAQEKYEKGLL
jgi:DnaK suppressor protein